MEQAELIALADLNYAEAERELTRRAGGVVLDEDGLTLWAGVHALPVMVNAAFPTGSLPAGEVLTRAERFFAARRRGYTVLTRAHVPADAEIAAAAEAAGFLRFGAPPGMVLDHRLPDAVAPAGLTLRRVATAADVAAFTAVSTAAWGAIGMAPDVAPALFARPEVLVAPHIAAFVVHDGDQPVAAAMAIATHGIAGIYWVGTVPAARGRGLAALCTRAAGNAGFDMGARLVTLQASEQGEPVYRRMGYVEVTRYPYYVRFTPPAT